jgi:arylsulfatase A-like enzyme
MLVHRQMTLPDSLMYIVEKQIGPAEEDEEYPRVKRMKWSVDALLQIGLDQIRADVLILWITEPDGSAHHGGIGSPLCVEALKMVDAEIERLMQGLKERGLREKTNIFFISDHGFSTRKGDQSLTSLLIENGLKSGKSSTDVVIANDAIYINDDKSERLPAIVQLLQKTDWIGPVFTRGTDPQSMQGYLPGTLSFNAVMWDHPRSADILTAGNWTSQSNEYGFPGTVMLPGKAGHNSTSPFDIHASFFATGPDIKVQESSSVPTGNVDIAPTALYLLGVDVPDRMDGRVIREVLKSGPPVSAVAVRSEKYSAETTVEGTPYRTTVYQSFVDGTTYLDSTVTIRNP